MPTDALRGRCRHVIEGVLKNNEWALVSASDASFAEAVRRRVVERFSSKSGGVEEVADDAIGRAAKNVYCTVIYEAYKNDGSDEQVLAMTEVKRFVYRRLLAMTHGDEAFADECAQDATTQAWLRWSEVRDPGRFLGYVLRIGVNGVLAARRQAGRYEALPDGNREQYRDHWFGIADADTQRMVETNDLLRRVYQAVSHCLSRPEEVRIIMEHLVLDKSYKELARAWGKRTGYLHLLKFRAVKKLEECEEFQKLRREWLGQE